MAVEGTLDLFKLPEILQLISQQRKTGILTVQGQQDIVAISFLNGAIVAADALNQTLEEGLSKVLLSEGLIAAPDLTRAMAEHQSSGGRLLDLLVERRLIDRTQVLRALRLQIQRLVDELLRWDKGDFKFYSGDEVFYEEGFIPLSVEELLLQAAEEDFLAATAARAQALASAPAPAAPAAPAPRAAAPAAAPGSTGGAPGTAAPFRQPPGPLPVSTVPSPAAAARPAAAPPPAQSNLKVMRPAAAPARPASISAAPVPASATAAAGGEVVSGAFRKMTVERRVRVPLAHRLVPPLLGAGLAVLLVATLLSYPVALMLPFPWQDGERAAVGETQRTSLYLKIDRAAKTHFLLEGSFPDGLSRLAALGLLSAQDLRDTQGRALQYSPGEESYTIQPLEKGGPVPGEAATEAITGNFLIDPEFLKLTTESHREPLVLLD